MKEDQELKEAFEKWEELSRDTKKWVEYETRHKQQMDHLVELRKIELREERTKAEGEHQKAIKIAIKMLAARKNIEEVVEFTELSPEEVKELKQELH